MTATAGEGAAHIVIREAADGDGRAHVRHHGLVPDVARVLWFRVALGQGDDSQGGRHPGDGLHLLPDATQPGELRRAAADVDDEYGLGLGVEQIETAGHRQSRLFDRVDDAQLQTRALAHPLDEGLAVVGLTAGLGGDRAKPARVQAFADHALGAQTQGVIGSVHGGFVQPAGARQALAEADDATEGINHAKTVARRARDQQAAVVGPQIECAIQRRIPT